MENAVELVGNRDVRSLLAPASAALVGLEFILCDDDRVESLYSRLALRRRRAPRENFSSQPLPSLRHSSVIRWQSAQQSRRGIVSSSWRRWYIGNEGRRMGDGLEANSDGDR